MKVFLDFEASSLGDRSYPIEVAWVFEDGRSESHLIAPAADWTDWDDKAEAVHGISRSLLFSEGEPHHRLARGMVETLAGHDLFASAPSWDGKWLSVLLRSAGIGRHTLRLADTDEAIRDTVADILAARFEGERLNREVHNLTARSAVSPGGPDAHRALADAEAEFAKWCRARDGAQTLATAGE